MDLHTLHEQESQPFIERGRFARICVEVDLQKQLIPKILIRRRVNSVQYEGLHLICFSCGKFGHRKEACSKSLPRPVDQMEMEGGAIPTKDNMSSVERSVYGQKGGRRIR